MPSFETIEVNLRDIFRTHEKMFEEMKTDEQLDRYTNAFISLRDKGHDIVHYEKCFEVLRKACTEALENEKRYKTLSDSELTEEEGSFLGGEIELREELNNRLAPKTIGRATLYNYLELLGIRKTLYTKKDADLVMKHMKDQKATRRKE